MTDPIADMLSRIRNGLLAKKSEIIFPYSNIKFEIAKILAERGWIESANKIEDKFDKIKIVLKYDEDKKPAITSIKRVSKPGRRIYVPKDKLPIVLNNYGEAIISTSRGLMTNKKARKEKVGGEIICEIY
ncbi:MAG: 30S ribosomal protein S8 [Patescibacteria group bacterium]|nr:30S ribosomal protein S8 [Patescibacteria group bacterium]